MVEFKTTMMKGVAITKWQKFGSAKTKSQTPRPKLV
jgi:hypothetical protein